MEDIVDTDFLSASISVHESATTLLETVNLVAKHRVIDIGIRHIVEVTAYDDRCLRLSHVHCQHIGLSGTGNHSNGIATVDGIQKRIAMHVDTLVG